MGGHGHGFWILEEELHAPRQTEFPVGWASNATIMG
jgi:hypothetical protein